MDRGPILAAPWTRGGRGDGAAASRRGQGPGRARCTRTSATVEDCATARARRRPSVAHSGSPGGLPPRGGGRRPSRRASRPSRGRLCGPALAQRPDQGRHVAGQRPDVVARALARRSGCSRAGRRLRPGSASPGSGSDVASYTRTPGTHGAAAPAGRSGLDEMETQPVRLDEAVAQADARLVGQVRAGGWARRPQRIGEVDGGRLGHPDLRGGARSATSVPPVGGGFPHRPSPRGSGSSVLGAVPSEGRSASVSSRPTSLRSASMTRTPSGVPSRTSRTTSRMV